MSQSKHSGQVRGQMLLEAAAASDAPDITRWHPTVSSIHSPSPPPFRPRLSHHSVTGMLVGGWGGGAVNGALIQQKLLFFFAFVFSLKMYSVVSFSCFFKEKSNCSSLPSVCNLHVIPRLPEADHSVVSGNH